MKFSVTKRTLIVINSLVLTTLLTGLASAKPVTSNQPSSPSPSASVSTATQSATAFLESLKLSDTQKNKIRGIRAARTRQIHQALDGKQWDKLQQEIKAGKKLNEALKGLQLNKDQKQRIGTVLAKSAESIRATLTPSQRQKLDAYLKQRHLAAQNSVE